MKQVLVWRWVRGAEFFSRTGWETYATTRRAVRDGDVEQHLGASTSQLTLSRSPARRLRRPTWSTVLPPFSHAAGGLVGWWERAPAQDDAVPTRVSV
jgi:hypothetical protein